MGLFRKDSKSKNQPKEKLQAIEVKETYRLLRAEKKGEQKLFEIMPIRVDSFDKLVSSNGFERGNIVLIAGGAGTGKTTFCFQSLFQSALAGEKCIYISFEENPESIKRHMKANFGWDVSKLEANGSFAIIKFDPLKVAKSVEALLEKQTGELIIEVPELELPFKPDRLVIDSLSALAVTFESEQKFRRYIKELFDLLEEYNSINLIVSETTQDPTLYSPQGIEEFLADVVIVFYNIRIRNKRMNAVEILKVRNAKQVKGLVPYKISDDGIKLLLGTAIDSQ